MEGGQRAPGRGASELIRGDDWEPVPDRSPNPGDPSRDRVTGPPVERFSFGREIERNGRR
ncbi:hypothetical protein BN903_70 [Halorubrum sp. AJ67]|nr:hypothetical protein BN903_70 [Halorubrum sp. AJ67]